MPDPTPADPQLTPAPAPSTSAPEFDAHSMGLAERALRGEIDLGAPSTTPAPSPPPSPTPAQPQPPAAPAAPPAAQPSAASIRDALSQRGTLDVSGFDSDDALLTALEDSLDGLQRLPTLEEKARYGDLYLQNFEAFNTFLEQQRQQQADQQAAQQPPGPWNPPQVDSKWYDFVEQDPATGRFKAKMPELAGYAAKLNEHEDYVRSQFQKFRENPYEFMQQGLQPWVEQQIQAHLQQAMAAQQQQQQVQQFYQQYRSELFELDPQGNIRRDPRTGQEVLSAKGQKAAEFAREAREVFGINDPARVQQFVVRELQRLEAAAPPAPAQPPAQQSGQPAAPAQPQQPPVPTNEELKTNYVQRAAAAAAHAPSRGGSEASAEAGEISQNPRLSFFQQAIANGRKQGLSDIPPAN